jgi:hypothetical protein
MLETRLTPAVTFAAQQTFAVGSAPVGAAVADFNGDGRPDLALVNYNDGTVSVLLNTTAAGAAAPAFTAQAPFTVGVNPGFVVAADFNGDGRPDLAVVNTNSKTVSVLLNRTPPGATTPLFGLQQTFALPIGAEPLVVADFNGDGRPDLAGVDHANGTAQVFLNTTPAGSGTVSFAAAQTVSVGIDPQAIVAADVNGDGRPDLVVANNSANTLAVLLNTTAAGAATAAFAVPQTFATGTGPDAIAVADVNGDGLPDLIAAKRSAGTPVR